MANRGMGVSVGAANKGRRVFRGSGRPTDGHIPQFLSHRRKPRVSSSTAATSGSVVDDGQRHDTSKELENDDEQLDDLSQSSSGATPLGKANISQMEEIPEVSLSTPEEPETISTMPFADNANTTEEAMQAEIRHLLQRIHNIQGSIQLSADALCSPDHWKNNCLHAVKNCVREWRSILLCHTDRRGDDEPEECKTQATTATMVVSNQVFGLVQMALQCGPLRGSNPGYFKRCGGCVARSAFDFLMATVGCGDVVRDLRFTEGQARAIGNWIHNVETAMTKTKPPSKSASKNLYQSHKRHKK